MPERIKDRLVLHHSGDLSPGDQYDKIAAYHKKKWKRTAYHWIIERSGEVKAGGEEWRILPHSGDSAINARSIGICSVGDYTKEDPTEAQMKSLRALVRDIEGRWGQMEILEHRDVKATSCPGRNLKEDLRKAEAAFIPHWKSQLERAKERVTEPRKTLIERILSRLARMV